MDANRFVLDQLAAASEGFTGAEIEEAIGSSRYTQHSVATEDLIAAIDRTYPISQLRAESIEALRRGAKNRIVAA